MDSTSERFSRRHGYSGSGKPITIREDAPPRLREGLVQIAIHEAGTSAKGLREIVCRVLRRRPDYEQNWSDPNVLDEVQQLLDKCEWFRVYDVIEAVHGALREGQIRRTEDALETTLERPDPADRFDESVNELLREEGIGWQLVEGRIQTRGSEAFEAAIHKATEALAEADRVTARGEIEEALRDLSRRPRPDITGAIQHAMAGLECIARDACGDQRATLGEILRRYPGLVPRPVDQALEKLWGYASEMARHIREGREPGREEAELVVGVAATVSTYLAGKVQASGPSGRRS